GLAVGRVAGVGRGVVARGVIGRGVTVVSRGGVVPRVGGLSVSDHVARRDVIAAVRRLGVIGLGEVRLGIIRDPPSAGTGPRRAGEERLHWGVASLTASARTASNATARIKARMGDLPRRRPPGAPRTSRNAGGSRFLHNAVGVPAGET